ncbi:MAG: Na(+)-translocating NADH-quinone reductase subunit A [Chlamydiia bacterium]|nr:Na(+)-translocating NADH-quinone reductase subunit A [Chlamydiia bacterium]
MVKISTTKGLNLPFQVKTDEASLVEKKTKTISIDLSCYTYLHLKLTKNLDELIKAGEVIAFDTHNPERILLSPFSGKIIDIQRGERRRLTTVIIKVLGDPLKPLMPINSSLSKEELIKIFFKRGLSFFIHKRPFHRVINQNDIPRSIFINTITSAPSTPSFKSILKSNEELFAFGLSILSKIATVHLVSNEEEFSCFKDCINHKAIGPHPIESPSIHILSIDPIKSVDDIVWSLDVLDVLRISKLCKEGVMFTDTVVSFQNTLIKTQTGSHIPSLVELKDFISGDPLTGSIHHDYLRDKDFVITRFTKPSKKEILGFTKLGIKKPTITKTYLGGFFKQRKFDNNSFCLGGEKRPFILKDIYEKYFPFNIYIEPLIKALLAKEYDIAISLGFLDLDSKDLAILEYICPSKIPLMSIFEKAKHDYLALIEK